MKHYVTAIGSLPDGEVLLACRCEVIVAGGTSLQARAAWDGHLDESEEMERVMVERGYA